MSRKAAKSPYDAVIVDETQDLDVQRLRRGKRHRGVARRTRKRPPAGASVSTSAAVAFLRSRQESPRR